MPENWQPSADLNTLKARAQLLAAMRAFFARRNVLEVDTPVLAATAPCEAELACLEVNQAGYLVPSPEYAMKRLLAAGIGSIYQLSHVFRAGEVGRWHNPEFTMLEWYRTDWSMAELIAEVQTFFNEIVGTPDFQQASFAELFFEHTQLDAHTATAAQLQAYAEHHSLAPPSMTASEAQSRTFWLDLIMGVAVINKLGQERPLCITHFPADDAVLIETTATTPPTAKRFEIYWQGVELANGAQELTDGQQARQNMQREQAIRQQQGESTVPVDEKLLASMESMPQAAGVAIGIDRLLALKLGKQSLAEAMPFAWQWR